MSKQKRALVTGAGGFIGAFLERRLKDEGYWVRSIDIKKHDYRESSADEFLLLDLREPTNCNKALSVRGGFDEVYQLAADRGGAGYMEPGECDMMRNNMLINIHTVTEASKAKVKKYFFASSVCVYRDMNPESPAIKEEDAYPASPDNEYGWEKLYSERMLLAYARRYKFEPRIARFHTTFGPESNWEGGREKAADAISRKVARAKDGGYVEIWGNGKAIRSFTYVDDLVDGIRNLMMSNLDMPVNIGSPEYVTVNQLAKTIIKVSSKKLKLKHVEGPVGVRARNFSNNKIYTTGWRHKFSLEDGISIHFPWVESQVIKKYGKPSK
jgi:GDP-D-mannose 3',5'-epimerase